MSMCVYTRMKKIREMQPWYVMTVAERNAKGASTATSTTFELALQGERHKIFIPAKKLTPRYETKCFGFPIQGTTT